jgi:hypothetical protein
MSKKAAAGLATYMCGLCASEKLYCMCKTPYNDKLYAVHAKARLIPRAYANANANAGPCRFYIQCDACGEWYHGQCVGVAEAESATLTDWSCPPCR